MFIGQICLKRKKKQFEIFDQNHGLTPSEACKVCDFIKSIFLWSKRQVFYIEHHQTCFLEEMYLKGNTEEISNF